MNILIWDVIWWNEYAIKNILKLLNTVLFIKPLHLLLFGVYLLLNLVRLNQISIIVTIEEFSFLWHFLRFHIFLKFL